MGRKDKDRGDDKPRVTGRFLANEVANKVANEVADQAANKTAGNAAVRAADNRADPPSGKLSKADYQERLAPLELALNDVARWLLHTGRRLMVVIEGRDTAGKGGVIAALSDTLNPRQCRVVALPKPSERERTQWYFQRYVQHLPAAGEVVLFDRSWYNRAGVERVMGYCTEAEAKEIGRAHV